MFVPLILAFVTPSLAAPPDGDKVGTLVVEVTGLRSDKGSAGIEIYATEDGFPGHLDKAKISVWRPIKDGAASAEFKDLPYGTYAVAVCHDENDNKNCDKNFFGIPTEGYATSNAAHRANMIPKFDKAKFQLNAPTMKSVISDLKY
jgi:uncharacterized protein (DUF2141 family)